MAEQMQTAKPAVAQQTPVTTTPMTDPQTSPFEEKPLWKKWWFWVIVVLVVVVVGAGVYYLV
ncbi:MAG: hypothetical protein ABIJ14_04000 [Nanoarchaeota archaeon]|nr:hypothetical protein [Nanoarchaeota archaeon]